jgi:hypothetical protein
MRYAFGIIASLSLLCLVACGVTANSPNLKGWTEANQNNFAPRSRTVSPRSVLSHTVDVLNATGLWAGASLV